MGSHRYEVQVGSRSRVVWESQKLESVVLENSSRSKRACTQLSAGRVNIT